MATNESRINPYQAPHAPPSEAVLAPDTEFLFNDKVVAGTATIVLPRVCVVTGSRELLLPRVSRLWWCPRWIRNARDLLIVAAVFVGIPLLSQLPPGTTGFSSSPSMTAALQLFIGAGLITGAIALVIVSYVAQSSVEVRWFISGRVVSRRFYFAMFSLVSSIGVTMGMIFSGTNALLGIFLVVLVVWIFASARLLVRGKRVLFVANQENGLFLIGGLSDKFLTEIRRIADNDSSPRKRESSG